MRCAYCRGAGGMLASSPVWAIAAAVALFLDTQRAEWTRLVGGAVVHPIALMIPKIVGRTGRNAEGNPLGGLAAASAF